MIESPVHLIDWNGVEGILVAGSRQQAQQAKRCQDSSSAQSSPHKSGSSLGLVGRLEVFRKAAAANRLMRQPSFDGYIVRHGFGIVQAHGDSTRESLLSNAAMGHRGVRPDVDRVGQETKVIGALFHGGVDQLPQRRLSAAGADSTLTDIASADHCFWGVDASGVMPEVVSFLRRIFRQVPE